MYIHNLKTYDVENTGTRGASVSVWFNFCEKHCPGCWNEDTWQRDTSLYIDNDEVVSTVLSALSDDFLPIGTLALLGGDPISPKNIKDCLYLVKKVKEARPDIEIICWTGFIWKQVYRSKILSPILAYLDILIDGRFLIERKVKGKHYGSDNQKIIDVQKSLKQEEIVEMALD
ncbi:4Fe-4S cluster-binding domain-containing protein [Tetragenococcus halophilus]|uniref:4Fe-4S cluster-binding domain-containing protein n=1 Tax=Tetragenococcus halophilus TaxID=51669 RepID=UPI0030101C90